MFDSMCVCISEVPSGLADVRPGVAVSFPPLILLLRFPCKAFIALLREKGKPLDPMVLGISNEF